MGILSGAMTVRRFRVIGEVPADFRDVYRDRLNEYAFNDTPVDHGKEEQEGWVQVHNLLDNSFDDDTRWLYERFALFAVRVDKKSLPGKLFAATVQKKAEAWCTENGVARCPAAIKTNIKEELEAEWLARTLPRVATTEAVWNITDGYVLLHSQADGAADRFRKRFLRTFGLELQPWSPLDWLDDNHLAEALLGSAPTLTAEDA